MATNIELVKALRERTGAGMMDCVHALEAASNDLDKATDWLREKGIAKQASKQDRIAAEGLTLAHTCEKCGKTAIVEVNCETDFVAKADPFRDLVNGVLGVCLKEEPKTVEELKTKSESLITDATVKLGEKLSIRRFEIVEKKASEGVATYIHMGGKIAVILVLSGDNADLLKGISMHIAASNPKYISEKDIPSNVYEAEKKVQVEACKNDPKLAGKPEAALENIIKGKVHKILAESVLEDQEYLMVPGKTVGQILTENKLSVIKFIRYQVGEGLEKRVDDFAAEVAAQSK